MQEAYSLALLVADQLGPIFRNGTSRSLRPILPPMQFRLRAAASTPENVLMIYRTTIGTVILSGWTMAFGFSKTLRRRLSLVNRTSVVAYHFPY